MKGLPIILLVYFLILSGCSTKAYKQVPVQNPEYRPNVVFANFEDLTSPKFKNLIEKYQLDTIFHGETDEFKRIVMLRHWIKSHIKIDLENPNYSGKGAVEGILDAALQGEGFHCGHFATVQHGILNAYGYVTRFLGAGPGVPREFDPHHGTNEVWLNQYNKWMVIDAKYEHHFEKDGVPLSALELRDEFLKNRGKDVVMLKGPDPVPVEFDEEIGESKEAFIQTFTYITWQVNGNMFTAWPNHKETVVWYNDAYHKNNPWIRSGRPHWAYNNPGMVTLVENRDAVNWSPNTIESKVVPDGNTARVTLQSDTPNFKEYQVKELPSGKWERADAETTLKLTGKKPAYVFRSVNLAGVTGPEHQIVFER